MLTITRSSFVLTFAIGILLSSGAQAESLLESSYPLVTIEVTDLGYCANTGSEKISCDFFDDRDSCQSHAPYCEWIAK